MARTVTGTGDWTALLSDLVRLELMEHAERTSVLANLIDVDTIGGQPGLTSVVGQWPNLTADLVNPLAEGASLTPTTIAPTSTSLTPAELALSVELSWLLDDAHPEASIGSFLVQQGEILTQQMEIDVANQHEQFPTDVTGASSATALTLAIYVQGAVDLKKDKVPGPYFATLESSGVSALALSLGGLGAFSESRTVGLVDRIGTQVGLKGEVGGLALYETADIQETGDTLGWAGAVRNMRAIRAVVRWLARTDTDKVLGRAFQGSIGGNWAVGLSNAATNKSFGRHLPYLK